MRLAGQVQTIAAALSGLATGAPGEKSRWRKTVLPLFALLFVAGCIYSASRLDLSWRELDGRPFLILALVLAPLSIAYSAVNMMLMGRAAGTRIGFFQGVRISALAQVAELLPLPGAAIVRGVALVRSGASKTRSAGLVLAFALLWIACSMVAAGLGLWRFGLPAQLFAGAGALATLAVTAWLTVMADWRIAAQALLLRVFGIGLIAARLALAFAIIDFAIAFTDCFAFAFASIAGSAASIAPAGLGISESLAALLAEATLAAPAAGFAAVALDRLTNLAVTVLVAALPLGQRPE